jgi:hypothetical protein
MAHTKSNFHCKTCDYKTNREYNWKKHLITEKHKNSINNVEYVCNHCGKIYKYQSGLSRHNITCNKSLNKVDNITSELFLKMVNQNNKLQERLLVLSNKPNIVNVHNKRMTINVFLQTQCKDAMNLSDFINNVNISLDDLNYTSDNGYIKGISNILYKNLEIIKPTERPFHCSDKKRSMFWIKEEDKWEKDNKQFGNSIDKISHKQIKQIKEWEKSYPNWNESDKETEMYLKMIQHVMGGNDNEEREKNKESIIRNISSSINIKDIMPV